MAKGGPNIDIEQGGIGGGSGINNILYFKDIWIYTQIIITI